MDWITFESVYFGDYGALTDLVLIVEKLDPNYDGLIIDNGFILNTDVFYNV